MAFGLPLRTRKIAVDVYGVLRCGRRCCQSAGSSCARACDLVDVLRQRQGRDVGLEAVDDRARLLAGAAVRGLDADVVAGLRLPRPARRRR
jgi:hypothetical protein